MVPVPMRAHPNHATTPRPDSMSPHQYMTSTNTYDNDPLKTLEHVRQPTMKGAEEHAALKLQVERLNGAGFSRNANKDIVSPMALHFTPSRLPKLDAYPTVCVVGCGFVGESLLRLFSGSYPTIGYDVSAPRIRQLTSTLTHNRTSHDYPLILTTTPTGIRAATHVLVSVPTLLKANHTCDTSYVREALQTILQQVRPGCTIIIESSVGVGTTRKLLGPHRHRYNCGMSPERVDPGRTEPAPYAVPKIVSGLTDTAREIIADLYRPIYKQIVTVSSCEVAEITKLHENCFRMVNIAYANEMADACRALHLDPAEVIEAASTKPFGFMPFHPGLGAGGHCIPVNPHYLMQSRKPGQFPILERATKAMSKRPDKLAKAFWRKVMLDIGARERKASILQQEEFPAALKQLDHVASFGSLGLLETAKLPHILIVGLGFKQGESILDFSPSLAFARVLQELGCARLAFYDPLVSQDKVPSMEKIELAQWTKKTLHEFDGVALCVKQKDVEWGVLDSAEKGGLLVRRFV